MADENLDALNDDRLLSRAESIKDSFVDLRNATREANQQLRGMGEAMADYGGTYTSVARSANKVADIQKKAANSSAAMADAIKEQEKNLSKVRQLNIKIDELYQRASVATGDTRKALLGQAQNLANARDNAKSLAGVYGEIAEDAAKLNSNTQFFNGIANIVSDIPGLRKLSGPFQDAAKAARETALSNAKNGKNISVMGAGMKGFAKSAASSAMSFLKSGGYIGLIVKGFVELVKLGLAADKEVTEISKGLGVSYEEATKLRNEFRAMSIDANELYINNEKRIQTLLVLNKTFGTASGNLSKELIDNQIRLTEGIGLTVEEAAELNKQLLLSGASASSFNSALTEASVAIQATEGVSIDTRSIFEDIAKTSNAIRINYIGSNHELARAASLARRYGLNLSMAESLSSSLLDFESSISSELEAELLTGRALNFERARAAALNNDYATVTEEIAKNLGSAEEFGKMNRLQQEAIAKSVGMTRDQLADTLTQQKILNLIGAQEEDSMKKRLQLAIEKYGSEEKARKALGKQVFDSLKQRSIQQEFNDLLQNAKQLLVEILGGPMAELVKNFSSNKEAVNSLINSFRDFGQGVINVGTFLDGLIVKPISAAFNIVKGLVKMLGGVSNAIFGPLLGLVGIDTKVEKSMDMIKSGYGDLAVGGAQAIDVGTNMIVGATDSGQANYFTSSAKKYRSELETPLATGGIVTKPTKALVGEAGAEAVVPLNDFYGKIDELIAAVKEGGDVFMDGNKVGQSLRLASYKQG